MGFLQDLFGAKPNLSNVQSPYDQLLAIDPQLSSLTTSGSGDIASELAGQVPGDVANQIKDYGAAWGISSGMPGSGISNNNTLKNLGLNSEQQVQTGQQDYLSFLTGAGSQMMNPTTQMAIDTSNSAPDPATSGITSMVTSLLGSVLGQGGIGSGGTGGSGCCFIFLESYNGTLPFFVRKSRDRYYRLLPSVADGYKRMALWLVPLMQRSRIVRALVWRLMVQPLTQYGGFTHRVAGYQSFGSRRIYRKFWFTVWKHF